MPYGYVDSSTRLNVSKAFFGLHFILYRLPDYDYVLKRSNEQKATEKSQVIHRQSVSASVCLCLCVRTKTSSCSQPHGALNISTNCVNERNIRTSAV